MRNHTGTVYLLLCSLLSVSPVFGDAAKVFVDHDGTGQAYLVTLPGENATNYWICAFPDYLGALHLYRASMPPEVSADTFVGELCTITAESVRDEYQGKRFEITKIERFKKAHSEKEDADKRVLILGTVMINDDIATVRVDKVIEGTLTQDKFALRIEAIKASGLEHGKQYKIEACVGHGVAPYRWTKTRLLTTGGTVRR